MHSAVNAGMCMAVAGGQAVEGALVQLAPCDANAPGQLWTPTAIRMQIFGDKCLEVKDGVQTSGAVLQISTCTANRPKQHFAYANQVISWVNTPNCVTLYRAQLTAGTPILSVTCSGAVKQHWLIP